MAITEAQYYQAPSTLETSYGDGMSVRFVHDMAANINAYCRYVGGAMPLVSDMYPENITSPDTSVTDETAILMFAKRFVPDGFTKLAWFLGHYRSAGSNNITWTLYSAKKLYRGPETFDSSYLAAGYGSATITTSSGTHAVGVDQTCAISRNAAGYTYLI